MVTLEDFIRVYPQSLDGDTCTSLIQFFEDNPSLHERVENNLKPNFTQLKLTGNHSTIEDIHSKLISTTLEYKNIYYQMVDERCFPEKHAFEQFRIKKYDPNGSDMFDTHVDVLDYESSRRYLSFMWYLNDVDEGGETVFLDISIKPKTGSLLVFPPLWMFPHRGNPPVSGVKYILSTYLHYK